ncbi:hypothetical protein [Pseudorhodoferax sp. Leaf265]|uniref:hypothetical protein n=1 Tax=Pseudorhodoferax sp. Leaf265 TaxID=1736315 RepID=UPI0012E8DF57|nr:hypothetical protein [Pseudorhodoferax sp. Leaf265]
MRGANDGCHGQAGGGLPARALQDRRADTTVHVLHGDADPVMPAALAQAASAHLRQLGTTVTLDMAPGAGHQPDAALPEHLASVLRCRTAT